jgi:Ca2+ transporting ATPase
LEIIAADIGKLGVFVALLTIVSLMIHLLIVSFALGEGWSTSSWSEVITIFIIGITIVVVAVPEGLPLAVTISLAFSVNKMRQEKNLVRHLHACESMGCCNEICSDKTGTITQNVMHVTQLYFDGQSVAQADIGTLPKPALDLICNGACTNSTAFVDVAEENGKEILKGNRTECALLLMSRNQGYDFNIIREHSEIVTTFPFNSAD